MNRFFAVAAALAALLSACVQETGTDFEGGTSVVHGDTRYRALATPSWTTTGALATGREKHSATLLPSGNLLVAGGFGSGYPPASELYDPSKGTWTASGDLVTPRESHSATLLQNGKVLVAAGFGISGRIANAELYDPSNGTWTATGSLAGARYRFTATLLDTGKVLVVGGLDATPLQAPMASAELYDPDSGTWSATGSLGTARYNHTATLLPSGKVLVVGGSGPSLLDSAELFNPSTGTWSPVGSLSAARWGHTATVLPSGKVLVAGGWGSAKLTSAELYDPAFGTWSATGSLATARSAHTATALPSGKVLVVGGYGTDYLASSELYDPGLGTWSSAGTIATARESHTATLLSRGRVLVAGGFGRLGYVKSAEIYGPPNAAPVAASQVRSTPEDVALGLTLVATDADGDEVSFAVVTLPEHGTLAVSGASVTYTPDADYAGPDFFVFTANDGLVTSGAATVSITVAPVNDAPIAQPLTVTLDEDASTPITLSATDAEGGALAYAIVTPASHGLLAGTGGSPNLVYAPERDFHGPDSFTYVASDGLLDSDPVTVTISVTPVNDGPVADGQAVTLDEDTSRVLTLSGTDLDGDTITFAVATPPAHGTLSGVGPNLTYTPAPDYSGSDEFTFTVNDGALESAPATVSVSVTPVDEPAGGCSCGTSGDAAQLGALLLAIPALRRRRRAP